MHLQWTETANGYRSGRYRIELVAPRMWALVVEEGTSSPRVISTADALSLIKHTAEEVERRDLRRRRIRHHLISLMSAGLGLALVMLLPSPVQAVGMVVVVFVAVRSLGSILDAVTGNSWIWLGKNYQ